jgi:O-antigen ligase
MRPLLRDLTEKALALVLGLFLLLPLFRGGNTDLAMKCALVGGVALLLLTVLLVALSMPVPPTPSTPAVIALAAITLLLIYGAASLVTVDMTTWLSLPGRAVYAPLAELLSAPPLAVDALALSLDPPGTTRALLALAPCIPIALAALALSRRSLLVVLGAFCLLATFEALIGLFQLGFRGASSVFVLDYVGHSRASGTFVNKNHFATLLAMALPLMIFRTAGQFAFFSSQSEQAPLSNVWWGVATAFVAAALVASLSRAGVLAGGIAATVAITLCLRGQQSRSRQALTVVLIIAALAASLASMTGLGQLVRSMSGSALDGGVSSRWLMNAHTWDGVVAFFPMGAGLGSYAIAFQRFQTPQLIGFIEYAHNDYLQLLFETGIIGVIALALLVVAAAMVARSFWRERATNQRLSPALACYLGALAFAIHAWFDFPSHIPGTAIIVTLLFAASMNGRLTGLVRRRASNASPDAPLLREARPLAPPP